MAVPDYDRPRARPESWPPPVGALHEPARPLHPRRGELPGAASPAAAPPVLRPTDEPVASRWQTAPALPPGLLRGAQDPPVLGAMAGGAVGLVIGLAFAALTLRQPALVVVSLLAWIALGAVVGVPLAMALRWLRPHR